MEPTWRPHLRRTTSEIYSNDGQYRESLRRTSLHPHNKARARQEMLSTVHNSARSPALTCASIDAGDTFQACAQCGPGADYRLKSTDRGSPTVLDNHTAWPFTDRFRGPIRSRAYRISQTPNEALGKVRAWVVGADAEGIVDMEDIYDVGTISQMWTARRHSDARRIDHDRNRASGSQPRMCWHQGIEQGRGPSAGGLGEGC